MEKFQNILSSFGINAVNIRYEKIHTGHINDTYKIYSKNELYILQKINTNVFICPEKVMHNIEIAQSLLKNGMRSDGKNPDGKIPEHLKSNEKNYLISNGFWRIYRYIDGASEHIKIVNTDILYSFGRLLGEFHRYTEPADISDLYITIQDFHNIEKRISSILEYKDITKEPYKFFSEFLIFYRKSKNILSPLRLVHNDVKFANVLIDPATKIPAALIDYDTIMPGYAAFDFGDAVRSACTVNGESIETDMLYAFAKGYFSEYRKLSAEECALGILSITAELSSRYLSDCLRGENYFKNLSFYEKLKKHKNLLRLAKNIYNDIENLIMIITDAKDI